MNIRFFSLMIAAATLTAACDDGGTTSTTTTTTSSTGGAGGATGGAGGATGGTGGATGGAGGTGGTTGGAGGTGGSGCVLASDAVYDGAAFDTNAAETLALRAQAGALNSAMVAAEADLAVKPTLAELTALYEAGTPSVKSITTPGYDAVLLARLADFEAAAGNVWAPAAQPSGPGGKFGNYIFTATGTDLRQSVEKGLFGAAWYSHSLGLAKAGIDAASLDRLLAAYGAHPSFPGDSAAMTNPDKLVAQYAERRSPKDPADASKPLDPQKPGPYFRIKAQFVRAQQAIQAGAACDAERDDAVTQILAGSERVLFSTVIFYLNDAALKLTKEGATEAELASGLHGYGESVSFMHGFRGLPADGRTITDAEIDELLGLVGAPHDGPVTSHLLVTDGATEVPKLLLAIQKIAEIYAWTAEDIDSFETSY